MFDFNENIYLSKELMGEKGLSLKAKCLFAYMDNMGAKMGMKIILLTQQEMMQIIKITSRNTLKKVLEELEEGKYITRCGQKYTLLKTYFIEVI